MPLFTIFLLENSRPEKRVDLWLISSADRRGCFYDLSFGVIVFKRGLLYLFSKFNPGHNGNLKKDVINNDATEGERDGIDGAEDGC